MEKKYIIDEQLLQAVAQYLYSKPMVEVEGLVNRVRQLAEYVEQPKQSVDEPAPSPAQEGPKAK